ncbi:MAG TPA: DUF4893 domain-containing protein [Rhizomicrobium sp.]|nr:DUF4893 domain-containing protein [Rhizomicrobium sp.]
MPTRGYSILFAVLAALATAPAAQAGWQNEVSPYDAGRLAKLDEARAKGLAQASPGRDIRLIRAVLDPQPQPVSARELQGDWRCRTIKLGGMTPDVVYSWFRCRIDERGDRLVFAKLSGTQRLTGYLYRRDPDGFVLLAGYSVKGEPPHRYSGNGPSAGAAATPDDAVGLLVATGPRAARIEFPYPVQESTFDVIELKR